MSDEPAARAVALVERLFALLHDCRALVPQLEAVPRRAVSEYRLYVTYGP